MKQIVAEICRAKREARIVPALATELEIKSELSRRGVKWTAQSFSEMLDELGTEPDIITHRLLRHDGYELINDSEDADDT